jgi:hypothetical protein
MIDLSVTDVSVTMPVRSQLERAASGEPRPSPLELTILMPCLNEAETVAACVTKAMGFLKRAGVAGEVLIADNGSSDGSQALAQAAGARIVGVLDRGYGAALMGGICAARGRWIIMGDADDSYDFENLDEMLARLRSGADLVMGNRFKGGVEPGAMPFLHRYLGNPVLSFLGRLFFKIPVGDFHCGLRGFSREAILALDLKSPGMEFASEMVVKAALNGLAISETPTTLKPDGRTRRPHLKTWTDGWRHLRFLLLHSPEFLFIYPGMLLTLMGAVGVVLLSRGTLRLNQTLALDFHSLTASCFALLIGVQLMMFGGLARRYAMVEGFLPPPKTLQPFLLGLTLETILRTALVVLLTGVAGTAWVVWRWAGLGFGPIQAFNVLRLLVVSLTAIAVAVQLAASGFLASVFTIRR